MKRLFPSVCLCSCLIAAHSFAGSATWNVNPTSGDWNTAENWTPNTVPNSMTDIATFETSSVTDVSLSTVIELGNIVFSPGANGFTIHGSGDEGLALYEDGIVNDSGQTQQFTFDSDSGMAFENSASAGDLTTYSLDQSSIAFYDTSSAGSANFTVSGSDADPGFITFYGPGAGPGPTAANATFNILSGAIVQFFSNATPANGTFMVDGGYLAFFSSGAESTIVCSHGGSVVFAYTASADLSTIDCKEGGSVAFSGASAAGAQVTAEGGTASYNAPAQIDLLKGTDGGSATFYVEGGVGHRTSGAKLILHGGSNADNAQVIVSGGTSGGEGASVRFVDISDGGTASITLSGNANFDISQHDPGTVTIGSLAGEGSVFLGTNNLTVGSNNQTTTYSGLIEDTGSLTKLGTGTLTLSGTNTYTGGTTITAGGLIVSNTVGSGSGTGPVTVQAGTLGGKGIIAGPTTIGTGSGAGSFLQPGKGASTPATLTLQNTLTFKGDSTYTWKLNTKKAKSDQVVANGVAIRTGAQFNFTTVGNSQLTVGSVFTAISNTATTAINGTFANLADGSIVIIGVNKLQVSYSGGDGNDLTLTVVP